MCGRFTLTVDPAQLATAFAASAPPEAPLPPRYNIAPSQPVAVVANHAHRVIEFFEWGLIPSWAKDPRIGQKMINARAETVAEKPSFRTALKKRRCLILADGFYEWQRLEKAAQPMYIQMRDGAPFALAGLWETWADPELKAPRYTCTIITTTPNPLMAPIHNRMPVILPPTAYDTWLTPGDLPAAEAQALLQPYDAALMRAYPVSQLVNNPRTDRPECVRAI